MRLSRFPTLTILLCLVALPLFSDELAFSSIVESEATIAPPQGVALVHYDEDVTLDALILSRERYSRYVCLGGVGSGEFSEALAGDYLSSSDGYYANLTTDFVIEDFDGDGNLDIATANNGGCG